MSTPSNELKQEASAESPDSDLIYGIDVMSLKLRLPSKRTIKVRCFVEGIGLAQITNEGISDDIKIIDGMSKKLLNPNTKLYFSSEDFQTMGFDKKEAKMRVLPIPIAEDVGMETTGVRIRTASGAISEDITKVIGQK